MVQGTGKSRGGIRGLSSLHLSSPKNKGAAQDGSVPLAVVLNYSHGERRAHRIAQAGSGRLERVAWRDSARKNAPITCDMQDKRRRDRNPL